MADCIVVIPVYEACPKDSERASFRQMLTVLKDHRISIVTHSGCDLSQYHDIADRVGKQVEIELFDASFFTSVAAYNELCFSAIFYERFRRYTYMLICQLDVWVFDDQLEYWCSKGYDYIGAPIFHAYNKHSFTRKFLGVGNGGFSLRKIDHCLRIVMSDRKRVYVKPLELIRFYYNLGRYTEDFSNHPLRRLGILPTLLLKFFGVHNTLNFYISNHNNEDLIFGAWSNKSWGHHSKLPDYHEAAKFSFEVNPSMLYEEIGCRLPFACHAFMKWEYQTFWSNHIVIDSEKEDKCQLCKDVE